MNVINQTKRLQELVSDKLQVPKDIYGDGMTLAQVIEISPVAINSIDMMEALISAMGELDSSADPDLPSIALHDSIDYVVEIIIEGLNK